MVLFSAVHGGNVKEWYCEILVYPDVIDALSF